MVDMVERVARALCQDHFGLDWNRDDVDREWTKWSAAAFVAIEAMRTPTLDMKQAGSAAIHNSYPEMPWPTDVWLAMVDAALVQMNSE